MVAIEHLAWSGRSEPLEVEWALDMLVVTTDGVGGIGSPDFPEPEPNRWKLVVNGPNIQGNPIESSHKVFLFEIANDPYEEKNVADSQPKIVAQLVKKLIQYRQLQPESPVAYHDLSEPLPLLPTGQDLKIGMAPQPPQLLRPWSWS